MSTTIIQSSRLFIPMNGGEVILCTGVFETPRILAQTVVENVSTKYGPHLSKLGNNLQDHVVLNFICVGSKHWQSK